MKKLDIPNVTMGVYAVTPEDAEVMLGVGGNPRPIATQNVKKIVHNIVTSAWRFNGESIIIADDGSVLDGQQRLTAIIESQTTCTALIVRGVSQSVFDTIDIGKNRTLADLFAIDGHTNYKDKAPASKLVFGYESSPGIEPKLGRNVLTDAEMKEYFGKNINEQLMDTAIKDIHRAKIPGKIIPHSYLIFLYYEALRIDYRQAMLFFSVLMTGDLIETAPPAKVVREKLLSLALSDNKPLANDPSDVFSIKAAFIIDAWNKYRKGKHTKTLKRWAKGTQYPQMK